MRYCVLTLPASVQTVSPAPRLEAKRLLWCGGAGRSDVCPPRCRRAAPAAHPKFSGIRSAGVYYPAAVEAAGEHALAAGEVLGAAMAHEIGHLVLGRNAHSREGLMSPEWKRPQFKKQLSIGELIFTSSEEKLLRNELTLAPATLVIAEAKRRTGFRPEKIR